MNYIKPYADFLRSSFSPKRSLRIVFDCSDGTTGMVLEALFSVKQNCETILLNKNPDGNFPAHGPNPLSEGAFDQLSEAVIKNKADLGIIFDADGDRAFFVDDLGRRLDPSAAILMLAARFTGEVVLPVNIGPFVRKRLAEMNRQTVDSRIGHYFLKKITRERGADFAAEQSGHYYFKKFFGLDSGILSAIEFVCAVGELSVPLSVWVNQLPHRWISEEINFKVIDKEKALTQLKSDYSKNASRISELDGLSFEFKNWWFNVRPSNTEDFLRLNLEAENEQLFQAKMKEVGDLLSLTN